MTRGKLLLLPLAQVRGHLPCAAASVAIQMDGKEGLRIAASTIDFAKKSIFSNRKLELETSNSLFSNVVYSGI
jgi:hypothetical protein